MAFGFKYFRRHQKAFFAGLTVMCMLAFTIGDILDRLIGRGSQGAPPVGSILGQEVTRAEFDSHRAARDRANRFMLMADPMTQYRSEPVEAFGPTTDDAIWDRILMLREADRLGVRVPEEFIVAYIKQASQGQMSDKVFSQIVYRMGVSTSSLYQALGEEIRILLTMRAIQASLPISPRQAWEFYRDLTQEAVIQAIRLPVRDFFDKVPAPSPEEQRAHFERFKEARRGPRAGQYGYRPEPRVEIEYIKADYRKFAAKQTVTDKQVADRYEADKEEKYRLPDEPPASQAAATQTAGTQAAATRGAATPAAATQTKPRYRPLAEVAPEIRRYLLDRATKSAMERAIGLVRGAVAGARRGLHGTEINLASEAKRLDLEYGGRLWLTHDQARQLVGLGQSLSEAEGATRRRFPDDVFQADFSDAHCTRDAAGNLYLYVKLEHVSPTTVAFEDVADQVRQDLLTEAARPLARQRAEQLAEKIRKADGRMSDVAETEKLPTELVGPFTRKQPLWYGRAAAMDERSKQTFKWFQPVVSTVLDELPEADDEFLEGVFRLEPQEVQVLTNAGQTAFYVVRLLSKTPVEASAYERVSPFINGGPGLLMTLLSVGVPYGQARGFEVGAALLAAERDFWERWRQELRLRYQVRLEPPARRLHEEEQVPTEPPPAPRRRVGIPMGLNLLDSIPPSRYGNSIPVQSA